MFHSKASLLPLMWAKEGDVIISNGKLWEFTGDYCNLKPISSIPEATNPSPWGWSLDARRQFKEAGFCDDLLPDDDTLALYRNLSHRKTARALLESIDMDFPLPLVTRDADEAMDMVLAYPGCYVKSPWSGSGRGVFTTHRLSPKVIRSKIEGIIHRQGDVVVEHALAKELDFAVLFDKGRIRGVSVFVSQGEAMYKGNLVASQERLRHLINHPDLDKTIEAITPFIANLAYHGPLGVDMMVTRDRRIMPCVEVNLRRTMGHVAMSINERFPNLEPFYLNDPVGFITQVQGWDNAAPLHL